MRLFIILLILLYLQVSKSFPAILSQSRACLIDNLANHSNLVRFNISQLGSKIPNVVGTKSIYVFPINLSVPTALPSASSTPKTFAGIILICPSAYFENNHLS